MRYAFCVMRSTLCVMLTQAIILNQKPFKEHDVKITVYTIDQGKLELIARGVKKIKSKLAGHLEPICLSNIMVVHGRYFNYIGSAVSKNCYLNIKNNLDKICCARQALNLVDQLTKQNEGSGAEIVFDLLQSFLDILDIHEKNEVECTKKTKLGLKPKQDNHKLLFHFFTLKLLSVLGYQPELYNCVVCKNKITLNNNWFDLLKGGLICSKCSTLSNGAKNITPNNAMPLKISNDCIKVLRLGVNSDFKELIKLKINEKLILETTQIIFNFQLTIFNSPC
ncbi:DNA repair protein RecO [Patescibacteria group bacterium]|nr:DNA repair protein RecO [Patescibacteria group bacterium]